MIKSVSNIIQCFSCLLDEGIAKICKKNPQLYFEDRPQLSIDYQGRVKDHCQIGQIGSRQVQKAIVGLQFLAYFCYALIK